MQGVKGFDQIQQGGTVDHAVDHDGQLRLPAGGHALDAVGHGVHVLQQTVGFLQQGLAGFGGLGLARAAVEQQHIQRLFHLAHAVGQGAGDQAQGARGGGKAAGVGDHLQHGQTVGGEHVAGLGHGSAGCKRFE